MANFHVDKMLGKVIGGYEILEHLGSGGMPMYSKL